MLKKWFMNKVEESDLFIYEVGLALGAGLAFVVGLIISEAADDYSVPVIEEDINGPETD